ncbi:MAG: phosphoribosylanthranilate isomerase [Nitrospiraceae bacterium]|nr:MAG: phosphoribosylanthranilate isomerase [Nitrospiraceae bacterium]
MVRVKICGITNPDDAFAALDYGADALGFVFYPRSPRSVSPEDARKIISSLPPFVSTVGVFVDLKKKEVDDITCYAGLNIIQLHGSEPPEYCNDFAGKKVIKAIRVKELSDLEPLSRYKSASAFLLDTYSPGEIGGTGRIFNWEIAIEAKKSGRIILAGGLTPDNIEEAIRFVQPYGVDVASGVEGKEKGKKDHKKLRAFIEKARSAGSGLEI